MSAHHRRLGEDVVHVRLTRSELAVLVAVLEMSAECPDAEMATRIAVLARRVRQLVEALG